MTTFRPASASSPGRWRASPIASSSHGPGSRWPPHEAGLSLSRYLDAREQLVRGGLLEVKKGVGRGQSSIVWLLVAQSGPWSEGEVSVELVEAVLAYSRQRGPARVLLATLAALADGDGVVEGLTTEELCRTSERSSNHCAYHDAQSGSSPSTIR